MTGRDSKFYFVDLIRKDYCCKCFYINKYPCVHPAAAKILHMKKEDRRTDNHMSDLCPRDYWMKHWSLTYYYMIIYSMPHKFVWVVPYEVQELSALLGLRVVVKVRVKLNSIMYLYHHFYIFIVMNVRVTDCFGMQEDYGRYDTHEDYGR